MLVAARRLQGSAGVPPVKGWVRVILPLHSDTLHWSLLCSVVARCRFLRVTHCLAVSGISPGTGHQCHTEGLGPTPGDFVRLR